MDLKLLAWGRAAMRRHHGNGLPTLWLFTDAARLPDPRAAVARLPRHIAGVVLRHDSDPDRAALGHDLARICRSRRLALVVAGDVRLAARLGAGVHLRGGRWPGPLRRPGIVTSSAHNQQDLRRAARNGAHLVFLSPAFATASHPGAPALGACRWALLASRAIFANRGNDRPDPCLTTSWPGSSGPTVAAPAPQGMAQGMPRTDWAMKPGKRPAAPAGKGRNAARSALSVAALGGIDGCSIRRLPRSACAAVGAIGALA